MGKITTPINILILIALLITTIFIGDNEVKRRAVKGDLIELSGIQYGLFNVDEWKVIIEGIIKEQINDFQVTDENEEQLRNSISSFLYTELSKLEKVYHKENQKDFMGFVRSGVASVTNIFGVIKDEVPEITDDIIHFMDDPKNKGAIKEYLVQKIHNYTEETSTKMDYTKHDEIIKKYGLTNRVDTISRLYDIKDELKKQTQLYKFILLLLFLTVAALLLSKIKFSALQILFLSIICFVFLLLGLIVPMIEIDARIVEINISIIGEPVTFTDQVLFYKSKSILEMIHLMFKQNGIELISVGIMILTFSVLFPVSKLIASIIASFNPKKQSNKLVKFLVFKTGKWSMADVMVVAIFMAYIGFSGIISEQLRQIDEMSESTKIISTNNSSLQLGFFSFTAFAFLGMLLSRKIRQ
ncbi:MAG: paraquat-inducible protein A [Brumimicrobium sp.]